MENKVTTLTGFSGCDMTVYSDKENKWSSDGEGVAFQVQAITWKQNTDGKLAGSIVLCWAPNPTPGPHNIIITCNGEDCKFGANVLYEVILLDSETGEEVEWDKVDIAKIYHFIAEGYTGWIKN